MRFNHCKVCGRNLYYNDEIPNMTCERCRRRDIWTRFWLTVGLLIAVFVGFSLMGKLL